MSDTGYVAGDQPALACLVHEDAVAVARLRLTHSAVCMTCKTYLPGRALVPVSVQELEDAAVAIEQAAASLTDGVLKSVVADWRYR